MVRFAHENRSYTVAVEPLDRIFFYWCDSNQSLAWNCLFVLPVWLKVWWKCFANGSMPEVFVVRCDEEITGIAPFQIQGSEARFIGNADVCDYQDVIVAPGRENDFYPALIGYLRQNGVNRLDLYPIRSDSNVLTGFNKTARELACETFCEPEDVSYEMDLPETWDKFLAGLSGKQRHEIRRKLRRLEGTAAYTYRDFEDVDAVRKAMKTFLDLFKKNRADKAEFMTPQLTDFFLSLADSMAEKRMLRLSFLYIEDIPVASVMCFDYCGRRYLYNNGYDERYRSLSVGVLSKVLNIQNGIENGIKVYDFLKGSEFYKRQLGGKPVQLHRFRVRIH